MAYSNPTSPWACAPLLVPKPGPARFRFTVDLRPVNAFTVKHQYPMPNLEHELTKLSASKYFAPFDLSNGYWQLALDKEAQALQSFITPDGILSDPGFTRNYQRNFPLTGRLRGDHASHSPRVYHLLVR